MHGWLLGTRVGSVHFKQPSGGISGRRELNLSHGPRPGRGEWTVPVVLGPSAFILKPCRGQVRNGRSGSEWGAPTQISFYRYHSFMGLTLLYIFYIVVNMSSHTEPYKHLGSMDLNTAVVPKVQSSVLVQTCCLSSNVCSFANGLQGARERRGRLVSIMVTYESVMVVKLLVSRDCG